ncbi:hypothetical protein SCHPADRAFT_566051 [Schizopora paradoxa]|uniref:Uncharacterized protein n=1 Tax=Schizopora paradoxa TaxID=27342 RepID=A0A0H2RC97_9AGAM|nr:hypothetical protein SCHPADRAFT_566051 [Schizopora paradoxa]
MIYFLAFFNLTKSPSTGRTRGRCKQRRGIQSSCRFRSSENLGVVALAELKLWLPLLLLAAFSSPFLFVDPKANGFDLTSSDRTASY